MRKLTLHEKITFKGILIKRGLKGPEILKLTMESLFYYWKIIYGPYKSLMDCFKQKYL